jgi:hypothetical protein
VISRLGRPFALVSVAVALACCSAPSPAAASIDPVKPICSLAGLVSTLAGKICSTASHAGRLLGAGKKLLTGHLGSGLKELLGGGGSGGGGSTTKAVTIGAIALSVVAGARFVLHETAAVISATTRPELQSTWFSAFYWRMAAVSALLTLPFLCAAAIQAMIRSDLSLLARSAFGYLPLGLIGVSIAAPLTMLLLSASDELSHIVSSAAGNADTAFLDKAAAATTVLSLFSHSPFVAFFVGLLAIAAAMVLWCELLIRSAAVYVIVLMLPLFFAALVWPARRVWAVRAVELLVALILAKFAIVAVLALGGAAIGHTLIPSITSMLAGATLVLLAAFSPWALLRLLPLHELAAGAAGGLRAAPGQQLALGSGRADDATAAGGQESSQWLQRGAGDPSTAARDAVDRLGGRAGRDGGDGAAGDTAPASGEDEGAAGNDAGSATEYERDVSQPGGDAGSGSGSGSAAGGGTPNSSSPSTDPAAPIAPDDRLPGMEEPYQAANNTLPVIHFHRNDPRFRNDPEPDNEAPAEDVPPEDHNPADDHDPRPPAQEPEDGPL